MTVSAITIGIRNASGKRNGKRRIGRNRRRIEKAEMAGGQNHGGGMKAIHPLITTTHMKKGGEGRNEVVAGKEDGGGAVPVARDQVQA